jgi:hypothetical protein
MIAIDVDANLKPIIDQLKAVGSDRWPAILAKAANETGYYVLNKIKQQMPSFLDRPTNYTLNSMFVDKATPAKLETTVKWKDSQRSAGRYLQPEVFGGDRKLKGFETALISAGFMPQGYRAVPSKYAPLDAFGNVSRGLYQKILGALKANPDAVQRRHVDKLVRGGTMKFLKGVSKTAANFEKKQKSEQKAQARARSKFVVILPNSGSSLVPGIYQRSGGRGLDRLFSYVSHTQYKAQFPFYDIGAQAASSKFPSKLAEAIDQAVSK